MLRLSWFHLILAISGGWMLLLPVSDEAAGVGGGVFAQLALEPLLEPGRCGLNLFSEGKSQGLR